MDAFGHQEILESLSQTSGGSRGSGNTNSLHHQHSSRKSNCSSLGTSRSGGGGATSSNNNNTHQHGGKGLHSLLSSQLLHSAAHQHQQQHHHHQHSEVGQSQHHHYQQQQQQQQYRHSSQRTANSSTTSLSHVDEAYRRLGQRLSAQAHGDALPPVSHRPVVIRIQKCDCSAFSTMDEARQWTATGASSATAATASAGADSTASPSMVASHPSSPNNATSSSSIPPIASNSNDTTTSSATTAETRTLKVPKRNYADHGNHQSGSSKMGSGNDKSHKQRISASMMLKCLTLHAKDMFLQWQPQENEPTTIESATTADASSAAITAPGCPTTTESFTSLTASDRTPLDDSTSPQQQQLLQSAALSRLHLAAGPGSGGTSTSGTSQTSSSWRQSYQPQQHSATTTHKRTDDEGESSDDSWGYPRLRQPQQYPTPPDAFSSSLHNNKYSSGGNAMMIGPPTSNPNSKGLLSSVMEGNSENASASTTVASGPHGDRSQQSVGSRTISTKESAAHHLHQLQLQQQRGKCLTVPAEAVSNDGYDNVEGNLIVHDNDVISIPKKSVKTLQSNPAQQEADYRVTSMLGQGTFAQVFQCVHLQTGRLVAVKIIKNKPAYTRQAAVEVDIFRALQEDNGTAATAADSASGSMASSSKSSSVTSRDYMVNLECFFFYRSHLCLVFELLGQNLYEVLKRRQFRGLPLSMVRMILQQALVGIKELSSKGVVHCDLKPENMLAVSETDMKEVESAGEFRNSRLNVVDEASVLQNADTGDFQNSRVKPTSSKSPPKIKLIDFGSACFEGYTAHTYIQSRFYRSPEVLIGLPYDSAIDMWSLGCVAAELFLGLPILPGVHEHDQLGRITEMIGKVPDWMLDQGSKSTKYYLKFLAPRQTPTPTSQMDRSPSPVVAPSITSPAPPVPQWRLKSQTEYIGSLTENEIRKKGGQAKLEKQPGNRYFKCKRLADILLSHAQSTSAEDKEMLPAFAHFLYGLLDPDPWKRWTAFQAIQHPFLTGETGQLRKKSHGMKINTKDENHANLELGYYWQSPWDPSICRRKLLSVQRLREKQQSMRRNFNGRPDGDGGDPTFVQSERRRQPKSESVSPANFYQTATPMDESPMPGKFPVRSIQVASSSTSQVSVTQPPLTLGAQSHGDTPSLRSARPLTSERQILSLANDALSGPAELYSTASVPTLGPKSFAGESGQTASNADFAYALQRPGVVPGPGSLVGDTASVCSFVSVSRSEGLPNNGFTGRHFVDGSANAPEMFPSGKMLQSSTTPTTHPLTQSSSLMSNQTGRGGGASVSGQEYSSFSQSIQFASQNRMSLAGGVPSSDASSITMQDSSYSNLLYHQNPPQQQQSMYGQQQPQVIQKQGMQQQIYPYSSHPPIQYLPSQMQPQFQQIPMQQQPVYLASAPGGGCYYVTTSATGQPILLQPVAVLDQHSSPYVHNNTTEASYHPQGYGHPSMMPSPMQLPMQAAPMFTPQQFGHDQFTMQQEHAQQRQHAVQYSAGLQQQHPAPAFANRKKTEPSQTHFRGGVSM